MHYTGNKCSLKSQDLNFKLTITILDRDTTGKKTKQKKKKTVHSTNNSTLVEFTGGGSKEDDIYIFAEYKTKTEKNNDSLF